MKAIFNKKYFITSILLIGFCFPLITEAKLLKSQKVDKITAQEKGITVSTKRFNVAIPAGVIDENFKVKIRKPKKTLKNKSKHTLISPSLRLEIYNNNIADQNLEEPITVRYKYSPKSNKKKFLAYFDRSTRKWKKLETRLDKDNNYAYANIYFPYIRLAVFEHFKKKELPQKIPNYSDFPYSLDSAAAVVIDANSKKVLFNKNKDQQKSIASLTKIATALTFLNTNPNLNDVFTYHSSYDREGARLFIKEGETLTFRDLFYVMLSGSANNTAISLSNATNYSSSEFIYQMNAIASDLNLHKTQFVEPSGLNENNMSTAHEYAKLAKQALKEMDILQASTTKTYEFSTINTNDFHRIVNLNKLLYTDLYVTGTKTGFTYEALYCLMVKAKSGDEEVIAVILGNPNSQDRFDETYDLINWAFNNYDW
ncbi:MAG: hypothetical protein ABID45_01085 [Patescibacteria group bacterium]